ncbi:hypothetical protein CDL15_Pgr024758 [Punica granatum]|uniref:Uncharacterized protein n=1 Tax=Punica granatum TaxID=22663 RepID=A0A218VV79_PUNGR|nr:hypothetical protein CDL15_Pgr024758 [Punica granatum]
MKRNGPKPVSGNRTITRRGRRRAAESGDSGRWAPQRRREEERVSVLSAAWGMLVPIWASPVAETVGIKGSV